jgi:hypothetical protein
MATVTTPAAVVAAPGSYVEWGAVLAGAFSAAALSFLLLTFGSAIGLSMTSAWPNSGVSGLTFIIVATLWAVLVQVGSFAIGGYIAGRMRSAWPDTAQSEGQFRDGAHGFLVWAVGVVISAVVAATTLTSAVKTTAQIGASVAGAAGAVGAAGAAAGMSTQPGGGSSASGNPLDYVVDLMFRMPEGAGAAGAAMPPATAQQQQLSSDQRAEAGRILATGLAQGDIAARDRQYLARLVSMRTGMPQADAEQRVNQVVTEARNTAIEAERKAREAAEKARKAGIAAAFLTAATLLISAAAAAAGAACGGRHRDERTAAVFFGASRLW